jgi:hypothetical protein
MGLPPYIFVTTAEDFSGYWAIVNLTDKGIVFYNFQKFHDVD